MKRLSLLACLLLSGAFAASAHDLKTDAFQVTGEVSAMDADSLTVMKGKERFHITKDAATKMNGDVKVGSKVTVKYQMYAKEVEAKEAKPAAKAPAKKE